MTRAIIISTIVVCSLAAIACLCAACYMHGYVKGSDEAKGKV